MARVSTKTIHTVRQVYLTTMTIDVRGGGSGGGHPHDLEKFQGKRKLLKNPE